VKLFSLFQLSKFIYVFKGIFFQFIFFQFFNLIFFNLIFFNFSIYFFLIFQFGFTEFNILVRAVKSIVPKKLMYILNNITFIFE